MCRLPDLCRAPAYCRPVHEPPAQLSDGEVLDLVRGHWAGEIDTVTYLPVGFGGFHWQGLRGARPELFVTFDPGSARHTAESLEGAYSAGAALADAGLEFLHASFRAHDGRCTVTAADGSLSVTPWLRGDVPRRRGLEAPLLARLHRAEPPAGLPRWHPLVDAGLPDRLAESVATPWDRGPLGEQARAAIVAALDLVGGWTADYLALATSTDPATWVATHGEPGFHNQLVDDAGVLHLIDLESLKLGPRERDLAGLLPLDDAWLAAYGGTGRGGGGPDTSLLRMFDLEWRLDEIDQYAAWFAGVHTGTADDTIALGGLLHELERPDRRHYAS